MKVFKRKILSLLFSMLFFLLSIFFRYTTGLSFLDSRGYIEYSKNLLSSGNNDNICIEVGVVLIVLPFIYNAMYLFKPFNKIDFFLFFSFISIQLLFLASIEVGDFFTTVYYSGNYVLFFWLLTYIMIILIFLYSTIQLIRRTNP